MRVLAASLTLAVLVGACAVGPEAGAPKPGSVQPMTMDELVALNDEITTLLHAGDFQAALDVFERVGPRVHASFGQSRLATLAERCVAKAEDARLLHDFENLEAEGYTVIINGWPGVYVELPGRDLDSPGHLTAPRDCAACNVCSELPTLQ